MLTEADDLVCQPVGARPVSRSTVAAQRRIVSRSSSSGMCACVSQRQPWQQTSKPRSAASRATQGVASSARPQALSVSGMPASTNRSVMRP